MLSTLELAAKRKAQLYGYLEAIGQRLDLTETQYERARTSYEAVGAWLMGSDSPYLQEGSISPHGSIRIQTANRPFARSEFDVDLLDVLPGISERVSPAAVKRLVGDRLKESELYRKILVEKNRCWQLQYEGEFHLDVTPAIRNPHCGNGGLLVPDKTLRVWKPTHPIAFADNFEARARLQPRYRSVKFAEARADMEGLPERQHYKGPLKRGVQLCKRHRDIHFADKDSSLAPISIIITTLLGWSYEECVRSREYDHDLDVLMEAVRGMPNFIHITYVAGQKVYVIPNETTAGENFAEKWNEDPRRADAFYEWHENLVETLEDFVRAEGEDEVSVRLSEAFGSSVVDPVFAEVSRAVNAARATRTLGILGAAGLSTSARAAPIRGNTFYGR
jgi:hypothetical protein